ncbi:hypothetical protein IJ472_07475 [bacterium]|nr:hypothetical protein [bacterium]
MSGEMHVDSVNVAKPLPPQETVQRQDSVESKKPIDMTYKDEDAQPAEKDFSVKGLVVEIKDNIREEAEEIKESRNDESLLKRLSSGNLLSELILYLNHRINK